MSSRAVTAVTIALASSVMVGRAAADDHLPRVGVMGDLGVPDGGVVSLVVRPVRAVRLHAGVGSDLVTTGMRAGVTLVPLSWWCSPSLSVDVGRYPEGDANGVARIVTQDPTYSSPMLDKVGYDYVDVHVGLELGRTWGTFYLHGGASRTSGALHGLSDPGGAVTFVDDPRVTLWSPSVRIGLIVYVM